MQEIRKKLNSLSDQEYKKFHSSLCPNAKNMIGVRIPELRRMAKEIANTNGKEFLEKYQFEYYEERMLQGFVIGYMKLTIEERIKYLDKFGINYIVLDNLDIIIDRRYDINNYMKYLKLSYLYKILMVITK